MRYKGPYADMKGAYRWLLGVWLPQSGREPDDVPVFESYLNDPRHVATTNLQTDHSFPPETVMTDRLDMAAMPADVAAAFDRFPAPFGAQLQRVRRLMYETAAQTELIGPPDGNAQMERTGLFDAGEWKRHHDSTGMAQTPRSGLRGAVQLPHKPG